MEIIGINNLQNDELSGEKIKSFRKFAWNNPNFVNKYKEIVCEAINHFEINVPNNYNYDQLCEYIDSKLQDLSNLYLHSARKAENQIFKKTRNKLKLKFIWTDGLRQTHERLWKYHSHYKSTGCEKSKFLWKFFKMRDIEKNELNKKYTSQSDDRFREIKKSLKKCILENN